MENLASIMSNNIRAAIAYVMLPLQMLHWFVKHFIWLLILSRLAESKTRERILCVAGKDAQYYFRRPEGLDDIRACNIIHGHIYIVMMEISSNFTPLSNLTELIGSLNLYSNDRITSLDQLFPNLSVMRGDTSSIDSDPKVPQVPKPVLHLSWNVLLERINLTKLTYMEGPMNAMLSEDLCYFNTVNWKSIANYSNACPYAAAISNQHCWESCPAHCPYWSDQKQYCWSENTCQIECNCNLPDGTKRFCRFDGHNECCDVNCLGGCVGGNTSADCVACKYWTVLETGLCTNSSETCPPGTLELLNRFCVSPSYCVKLESEPGKPYKIHESKCLASCPPQTNDDPRSKVSCVKCAPDDCRRFQVANKTIMYMTDFPEPFTDLIGNLVINLEELSPSITNVLEGKLKSLRNITGSLKVYRSERIQGLDLFESLEEIGSGGCALSNGFCLTIHSNEFLQRLWRPKKGFLRILNGNVSIAHNPRLCQNAIDEFRKYLDPSVYVHQEGNGDRGYCSSMSITPVKIMRQRREQAHANVNDLENTKWSVAATVAFNLSHTDRLLTLSLYYRKANLRTNLTYYDPAFCDDSQANLHTNSWHRHVVNVNFSSPEYWIVDEGIKLFVTNITSPGLDPNSPYAIYALAQYMDGRIAISEIYRFDTITAPSIWHYSVQDFAREVKKNSTYHSLSVLWPVPKHPNGNITHYVVRYWETNYTLSPLEWHGCAEQKMRMFQRRESLRYSDAHSMNTEMPTPSLVNDALVIDNIGPHSGCGDQYTGGDQNVNMMIAALFQKQDKPSSPPDVNNDVYSEDMRRRHAISVHEVLGADYSEPGEGHGRKPNNLVGLDANGRPLIVRLGRSVNDETIEALKREEAIRQCQATISLVKGRVTSFSSKNPSSRLEIVCNPTLSIGNLTHFAKYKFEIRACFDPNPETGEYLCSEPIYFTERTAPHPLADIMASDMVKEGEITTHEGRTHRQLTITKPTLINGQILYFLFRSRAYGSGDDDWHEICIDNDPSKETIDHFLGVYHTKYEAQIAVETLNGSGNWSDIFTFNGIYAEIPTVMSVAIGTSAGLLLISAGLLTWYAFVLRRKRNQIAKDGIATPDWISMNPDYPLLTSIDIPSELELEREDIEVLAEIGRGSFGVVYRGLLRIGGSLTSKRCQVAVKSLRCDASLRQRHDFLHEALILAGLDCHHIIRLKGVVSRTQPIYVVMELMENGDLKSFLVKHRPDNIASASVQNVATALSVTNSTGNMTIPKTPSGPMVCGTLNVGDFTQMAGEVADGLAYLSAKKIVHRDLAARNCLVARDRTVKLGDFGLARDVYDDNYYHLHGRALLPIRWMAPESLRDGIFDTNSDVWSFGVLLWEIVTYGEQPYQGKSNEEVLEAVKQHRQVLNKPKNCPDKFYNLMLRCWQYKPTDRPSFIDIVRELLPGLRPDFLKVSYYGSTVSESAVTNAASDSSGVPPSLDPGSDRDDNSSLAGRESPLLSVHSDDKIEDDVTEKLLDNNPSSRRIIDKSSLNGGISFGATRPSNVYQFSNIL